MPNRDVTYMILGRPIVIEEAILGAAELAGADKDILAIGAL